MCMDCSDGRALAFKKDRPQRPIFFAISKKGRNKAVTRRFGEPVEKSARATSLSKAVIATEAAMTRAKRDGSGGTDFCTAIRVKRELFKLRAFTDDLQASVSPFPFPPFSSPSCVTSICPFFQLLSRGSPSSLATPHRFSYAFLRRHFPLIPVPPVHAVSLFLSQAHSVLYTKWKH